MNIRRTGVVLGLLLWSGVACPISFEMVYGGTGASALFTGVAAYKVFDSIWLSAPIAGAGGLAGYWFLQKFTPAGRIDRAQRELNKIMSYRLARDFFATEEALLDVVQDKFMAHTWPLIAAYDELNRLFKMSLRAIELADAARTEDHAYGDQAEKIMATAGKYIVNIKNAIKVIRANKDYLIQLQQHKDEQHHKEHMQIQQSIAAAQWNKASQQQPAIHIHTR